MSTLISFLFIITFAILAFFGLLVMIEYLRYFKRKIAIRLNDKLCDGVKSK